MLQTHEMANQLHIVVRVPGRGERVLAGGLQPDHSVCPGSGELTLPAGPATHLLRGPAQLQLCQPAVLHRHSPAGLPARSQEDTNTQVTYSLTYSFNYYSFS